MSDNDTPQLASPQTNRSPSDLDAPGADAPSADPPLTASAAAMEPAGAALDDVELEALLRLTLVNGLGPIRIRRLLQRFRSASAAVNASPAALAEVDGIGRDTAGRIARELRGLSTLSERECCAAAGLQLVPITSRSYPPLLRLIPDAPPILYVRGYLPSTDVYTVAMVGSRNCTAYGRDIAARLASGLAQMGLTVVSGGARGIDTAAHSGAVQVRGRTVVVLGSGLGHPYPQENGPLFDRVIESGGAVVSEFPFDTRPASENFPRRNRIISGLSLGTLVVEAPVRSGALITARLANEEHNRVVMALPGRADSTASEGCHDLIRDGAALVTNTRQILAALDSAAHLVAAAREAIESPFVREATAPLFETGLDGDAEPTSAASASAAAAALEGEHDGGAGGMTDFTTALRRRAQARGPNEGKAAGSAGGSGGALASPRLANLSSSQQRILEALARDPVEVGELAMLTGLAISQLQADLTMLQIRGLITRVAAGSVRREA